jgi:hypothetical protein
MVDVLDAMAPPADPTLDAPPSRSDDTTEGGVRRRHAPLLLVAAAVGFTAWALRSELHGLPYANDAAVHSSMTQFAEARIRAGHSPFDAWYPYLGLGSPQFLQYQTLSHIVTAALSIVFGDATFRGANYLLLCTWPVSMYTGARLLGLDRWQAGTAALLSPALSNVTGYGIEWSSFMWFGTGLWSMLWAIWLLPIALGLAWRAIAHRERIALATFVVGLTCALHFVTGYLVLLALGVFVLLRPPDFVMRLGRSAVIGLGGLLVFAFVFVPTLGGVRYANLTAFQAHTFWVDSYGPSKVFPWLLRGEVFDFGRVPIVSLLVLVGAVVSAARARRSEAARVPLALLVLSLLLYSGRRVVGPLVDLLPAGNRILLHRYIIGVHFAGLLLAGIGAVWTIRTLNDGLRRIPVLQRRTAIPAVLVLTIVVIVVTPLAVNRYRVGQTDASMHALQAAAQRNDGRDVEALVDIVKERNDGRVYAGGRNGWGPFRRVFQLPLYTYPAQMGADSIGFQLRTDSLSADVEPYFNEGELAQYDLFNVKYVLVPAKQKPSIRAATLLATRGDYKLYEVHTSGYLEVVDTTDPIAANQGNMADVMAPYVKSSAVAQLRHPYVAFDGHATPAPSIATDAPFTGPPGTVGHQTVDLDNAHFAGEVHASRPAWVMLKESYYPHWTASVDGHEVKPQMLAPSFIGVPVSAGNHYVSFQYRPSRSYPVLFAVGLLTLLVLALGPVIWRRLRRNRADMKTSVA